MNMKQLLFFSILLSLFFGCSSKDISSSKSYFESFKTSLPSNILSNIDQSTIRIYQLKCRRKLIRAQIQNGELVMVFSQEGQLHTGRILNLVWESRKESKGMIVVKDLVGNIHRQVPLFIDTKQIQFEHASDHPSNLPMHKFDLNTHDEQPMMIALTKRNGKAYQTLWCSLWWLFDVTWLDPLYLPFDFCSERNGKTHVKQRSIGNYNSIDLNRDIDCFNLISDTNAIYTLTVYADLPIDNDSKSVFDPKAYFAGHCFIELYKSNPYKSMRRYYGFYPDSRWNAVSGRYTPSKLVDDGGHEYQASYTISVRKDQFVDAIEKILELSNHDYHINDFNCVDFVLRVFKAGGGILEVETKYNIPILGDSAGKHTPNGLYEQIALLQAKGIIGANACSIKKYCLESTKLFS